MERRHVAISATDPVSGAGIRDYLAAHPAVVVADDLTADLRIVVVEGPPSAILSTLRDLVVDPVPVILVADLPESDLLPAIGLGVMAVLSPSTLSRTELITALTAVLAGDYVLPPHLTGGLVRHLHRLQREVLAPHGLSCSGLTTREIEVLRMLADGLETAEIAVRLNYAERTVKQIVQSINARLGLRNRTHAVSHALRHGLI
jgi:DNA-binding NarL/FixJ family response regulator